MLRTNPINFLGGSLRFRIVPDSSCIVLYIWKELGEILIHKEEPFRDMVKDKGIEFSHYMCNTQRDVHMNAEEFLRRTYYCITPFYDLPDVILDDLYKGSQFYTKCF